MEARCRHHCIPQELLVTSYCLKLDLNLRDVKVFMYACCATQAGALMHSVRHLAVVT